MTVAGAATPRARILGAVAVAATCALALGAAVAGPFNGLSAPAGVGVGSTASASASHPAQSAATTPISTPTPAPTVTAARYYVSNSGNDAAAGSLAAPWRTLQHAADVASPGATVLIRAGTYAPFVMKRSGSAAAPTSFVNYPGEKPTIDGKGAIDYTIRVVGAANVALSGLIVTGGNGLRQTGGGVSVENSAHVTVQNSDIYGNRAFGVRLVGDTDVLVLNNDIHDNAVGVRVTAAVATNTVRANRIHDQNKMMINTLVPYGDDAGGEGVAIVSSAGSVTVEQNQVWRNRALSYDYGYDGGAFSVYAASNWTIRNNIVWDNRNILETGTDGTSTCANGRFVRNLAYGATTVDRSVGMIMRCAQNGLVANNTFAGLQYFTFDLSNNTNAYGGSVDGLRVVNNVISVSVGKIYGIESALPANVVIDQNIVYNSGPGYFASRLSAGYRDLAAFRVATGYDLHSISASPLFKNVAANDYSLAMGSPAIDHGVIVSGVTDGFAGTAPDCGYLEWRPT